MILPPNNYAFTSQYLCFCNRLIINLLQKHFSFLSSLSEKSNNFPLALALLSYKISMDKNIVLWFSCFVECKSPARKQLSNKTS